jgi:hypothetical protein
MNDQNILSDYKVTSVYKVKKALMEGDKDWERQLNILCFLAESEGLQIDQLQIVAISRDWNRSGRLRDADYPKTMVSVIDIPKWSKEDQQEWIEVAVKQHQAAQHGAPRLCNDEERWKKDDVWAVMKNGRKSAVKLHSSEEEANAHLSKMDDKHYIEFRQGEYTRCEGYCDVAQWCKQCEADKANNFYRSE